MRRAPTLGSVGRRCLTQTASLLIVRLRGALGLRQPLRQDPHQLRRRLRPDLRPRVRQVVLDGRVRRAEAVGSRLLRPGDEDGRYHTDLAVGRASGGSGRASRHAFWSHSEGSGGSARAHREWRVVGGGAIPLAPTIPNKSPRRDCEVLWQHVREAVRDRRRRQDRVKRPEPRDVERFEQRAREAPALLATPGEMSMVAAPVGSSRLLSRITSTTWSFSGWSVAGSPRSGGGPGSIGTPAAPASGRANPLTWPQCGPSACWTPLVTATPF